jgi:uncharacterized membrane protein
MSFGFWLQTMLIVLMVNVVPRWVRGHIRTEYRAFAYVLLSLIVALLTGVGLYVVDGMAADRVVVASVGLGWLFLAGVVAMDASYEFFFRKPHATDTNAIGSKNGNSQ